jgi:hypothetical protein
MKRVARVLGILAVLPLVVAISLPFLIDANQFRPGSKPNHQSPGPTSN